MTLALSGPTNLSETVGLTPTSNGCKATSNGTQCTFSLNLIAGAYTASVHTYDAVSCSGSTCSIPASAKVLSSAANVPFTVVSGEANSLPITLAGVVASLSVAGLPNATYGTAFSAQPFSVTAKDPDGDVIVGTYATPVTLSTSDTSGATTVGGELLGSSDPALLSYSGAALLSATIGASATGATSGSATLVPVPGFTSISAPTGKIGLPISETLSGNFGQSPTVAITGTGVTMNVIDYSPTTIHLTFTVALSAPLGARTVTVSSPNATSLPQTFTVSNAGVDIVTLNTDNNSGSINGTGSGQSGDLRYEMLNAASGDAIVFNTQAMCAAAQCTIMLGGPLPPIVQNLTIDGGSFGNIKVDGGGFFRVFFVDTGTVAINNLQIQNGYAYGGNGGGGGYANGGGGAGLGGGLFVNKATAAVSIANDYFLNDKVEGGNGGSSGGCSPANTGGGGGGGMTGNFGQNGGASDSSGDGGGGGGVLYSGDNNGGSGYGFSGGLGGGGGGGAYTYVGGSGGSGYGTNAGGQSGASSSGSSTGGAGGAGGFGGGGGGGAIKGAGAAGGFGGGGGGGVVAAGGNGGPGGGGGGSAGSPLGSAGTGGSLGAGISGGKGGSNIYGGGGGGGAAAGPAIFVNAGTLTTTNSGASGSLASAGGSSGSCSNGTAGGSNQTPVFNYAGSVNGSTTAGGIGSALGSSAPSLRVRMRKRLATHFGGSLNV